MGITGLLPLMKGATYDVRLSKLKGSVAAIDTNGWIHRACYHCGDKIYMNEETDMFINYCINYCNLLRKHSITPLLVFDGQSLPAKSETKLKRQKRKQEVRKTIEELLRTGNQSKARYLMRTCVDVTFDVVRKVIVRCRKEQIDYIVSPYEADAQITYLVNNGIADFAITEDSDMLVFGCRRTLYKLDREKESGKMVDLDRLGKCFKNFDEKKFQYMCILSGCDYLSNLPGLAIGRAKKYFESLAAGSQLVSIENVSQLIMNAPVFLKMTDKIKVTDEYIDGFVRAVNTFDYQLVYSPFTENLTHLKQLKGGLPKHKELKLGEYAGEFFDSNHIMDENRLSFVINYMLGNIDTKTLALIDEYNPYELETRENIWWSPVITERIKSNRAIRCQVELDTENIPTKRKVVNIDRSSFNKKDNDILLQKSSTPNKKLKTKNSPKKILMDNKNELKNADSIPNECVQMMGKRTKKPVEKPVDDIPVQVIEKRGGRNMFRKKIETNEINYNTRSSKYFSKSSNDKQSMEQKMKVLNVIDIDDDDFDDDQFDDYKPKLNLFPIDLNTSAASSIDDDGQNVLRTLNGSHSLSSTQTTVLSQNSSITSSQSSQQSADYVPKFSSKMTQSKQTKTKPTRKQNNRSIDIRTFFSPSK